MPMLILYTSMLYADANAICNILYTIILITTIHYYTLLY